jgi:hypothetical protein
VGGYADLSKLSKTDFGFSKTYCISFKVFSVTIIFISGDEAEYGTREEKLILFFLLLLIKLTRIYNHF